MLENLNSLPQVAVNILNSSLTLSVINVNFYCHNFIRVEQNFINTCYDLNVVVWTKTAETTSGLQVALELD